MLRLGLAVLLLATTSGGGGTSPEPRSVAWDGRATRLHTDATARIRFAVPAADFRVTAHHFAEPQAGKLSDDLLVTVAGDQALLVGVFANPERLPLSTYVEAHLSFLRIPAVAITEGVAGKTGARAVLFDQPRTGQAFGQRVAVFALSDGRVVKLACPNRDEPSLALLFEKSLASFEEVAP